MKKSIIIKGIPILNSRKEICIKCILRKSLFKSEMLKNHKVLNEKKNPVIHAD